ncbi:MAG: 2TM domain-containing protein [Deltaproteobacteria bacterium]|nr:2TM domain-containing protein [Deltaproteobacteria bacterium]
MMNDEKYKEAKKRVRELKDFYRNLLTYVGVNILLIIINLLTSPGSLWFYWVTIFWGIAIVLHASKVFILKGKFLGKEWEEKKIKEIIGKESNSK